jgi:formate dehydrogenase subunit gamma
MMKRIATMGGFKRLRPILPVLAVIALAVGFLIAPGYAQTQGDVNPTAQSVQEQQLLQEMNRIQGRITIPDERASVLQQPQGRTYQRFHERVLPWIGSIAVLGMLVLLAVFFLIRGRIRTRTPETGVKIRRFNAVERFAHWLTATAFIVLAITGLNYVFGKHLILPLIGPEAFSDWSQWAKYAHISISWIFMAGIAVMFVIWIKDNIPDR